MSFISYSVQVPVWLLILLLLATTPLLLKLYRLVQGFRKGHIVKEVQEDEVDWKIESNKPSAAPKKSSADIAREKRHEEKSDIVHVLKIMAREGERGMLVQSLADQMQVDITKVQHAIAKLVEKELIEEVVGMSGTKYYLTQLGKNYCNSKGIH